MAEAQWWGNQPKDSKTSICEGPRAVHWLYWQAARRRKQETALNIWLAVGAAIGIALMVAVAVTMRRPRLIDDELNRPSGTTRSSKGSARQSSKLAQSGSLTPASLIGVLLAIRADRRTGTLVLSSEGRSCGLYFLFGHLFHVSSGSLNGEAALKSALAWPAITYTFDAEAPMPTEETIRRPIDQILADSQSEDGHQSRAV